MNRRNSLKLIGGSVAGIAGLALVNWRWQIVDRLTHEGFFSFDEEQLITAIAETFIPEGHPPILPNPDAKPIGALFEHCSEPEEQALIKIQLESLKKSGFADASQEDREQKLLAMKNSEQEDEKKFYNLMRSNTITGFTTVKEVMVDYRGYQVAPGYYKGCADLPQSSI
jgi:hypothetical protein